MLSELMGKDSGYCHGRGGSMHVANLAHNNLVANGIVGGGIPLGTGAGLAVKYKGGDQVVICFFGDGAINQGVFHESINLAAIYKLPVIFVVENNHYAVSTRIQDSTLIPNLSQRADGFGIPGISLDGNDAVVIHEEMVKVVARTRQVQGPTLVECKTYRHGGHHINDPGAYMPEEEMKYWKSKDPVLVLRKRLADEGVAEHELKEIEQRVEAKIEEAVAFAINSPEPSKEAFLAEISVF
jgi:TPP-dependent pyruvate/acetoin dehydrogenase alpha subunit